MWPIHHLPIYTNTDSNRFLGPLTLPIPIFRYEYHTNTDTDFLENTDIYTDYIDYRCNPSALYQCIGALPFLLWCIEDIYEPYKVWRCFFSLIVFLFVFLWGCTCYTRSLYCNIGLFISNPISWCLFCFVHFLLKLQKRRFFNFICWSVQNYLCQVWFNILSL